MKIYTKVIIIRPETNRSNYEQVDNNDKLLEDRTRECCKILR